MEAALNVSSSESAFPHSAPNAVSADRRVIEGFYEKVVKVKADVAALL
jgi:hypothetical protein